MGSQFKVRWSEIDESFQKILVGWSARAPFGEQVQKVIEPNDAVAIEVFIAASTDAPRSKNFKQVSKIN